MQIYKKDFSEKEMNKWEKKGEIRAFKEDNNIIITNADKTNKTVIMYKEDYNQKITQ